MMQPLCQRRPLPDIHCPLLPIVQKGKAPLHSAQYEVSCIPHYHRQSAMSFLRNVMSVKLIARAAQ